MSIYDMAVSSLKDTANETAKAEYPEMFHAGQLDQELDSIEDTIERMCAEYLLDGYGDEMEEADLVWWECREDLENEVREMVANAADTVADFLESIKEA